VDVAEAVAEFAAPVGELTSQLPVLLRGAELHRFHARAAGLIEAGVPTELAERAAGLLPALSLLDVVELAGASGADLTAVAGLYFAVSDRFQVDDLLIQVAGLPLDDRWDALARAAMRDDLYGTLAALTRTVQEATPDATEPEQRLAQWAATAGTALTRVEDSVATIAALEGADVAPLSVALRDLRSLVR
jgi:glutamate dehydrogenase